MYSVIIYKYIKFLINEKFVEYTGDRWYYINTIVDNLFR